jgi:asparagine synthetase B (glutamine-hydrolysing)
MGPDPWAPPLPVPSDVTPRAALEAVVERRLRRAPCLIPFSGGRDSSAVLALAVHVARKRGLPLPVAVTHRFATAASHEADWQELVVRHLGLEDWERLTWEDELDVVGPHARRFLRRHGLIMPMNAHFVGVVCERARGGSLMTGFGGDELLGRWPRRLLAHVLFRRYRPPVRHTSAVARELRPRRLREAELGAGLRERGLAWLRPDAREEVIRRYASYEAAYPLRFDAALAPFWASRPQQCTLATFRAIGEDLDVEVEHPFSDPHALVAFGRAYGGAGPTGRTRVMRDLFGDLLPLELLRRGTKAHFDEVFFNRHARAFAERWTGAGVDDRLVSPDALRAEWASEQPTAQTFALLQAAWLAEETDRVMSAAQLDEQAVDGAGQPVEPLRTPEP